jgi:hypothetical protein
MLDSLSMTLCNQEIVYVGDWSGMESGHTLEWLALVLTPKMFYVIDGTLVYLYREWWVVIGNSNYDGLMQSGVRKP